MGNQLLLAIYLYVLMNPALCSVVYCTILQEVKLIRTQFIRKFQRQLYLLYVKLKSCKPLYFLHSGRDLNQKHNETKFAIFMAGKRDIIWFWEEDKSFYQQNPRWKFFIGDFASLSFSVEDKVTTRYHLRNLLFPLKKTKLQPPTNYGAFLPLKKTKMQPATNYKASVFSGEDKATNNYHLRSSFFRWEKTKLQELPPTKFIFSLQKTKLQPITIYGVHFSSVEEKTTTTYHLWSLFFSWRRQSYNQLPPTELVFSSAKL